MFHTYAEAVLALRAAVAERGEDYTYPEEWKRAGACQYVVSSSKDEFVPVKGCIVGAVLADQGIALDLLHTFDGENPVQIAKEEDPFSFFSFTEDSTTGDRYQWEQSPKPAGTVLRDVADEVFAGDLPRNQKSAIRELFETAQSRQDDGETWASAVQHAESTVRQFWGGTHGHEWATVPR